MKNIEVGSVYLIKYKDASYSYVDLIKHKISMPKLIQSIGRIRRVEREFIDVGFSWIYSKDSQIDYCSGVVIPLRTIVSMNKLKPEHGKKI